MGHSVMRHTRYLLASNRTRTCGSWMRSRTLSWQCQGLSMSWSYVGQGAFWVSYSICPNIHFIPYIHLCMYIHSELITDSSDCNLALICCSVFGNVENIMYLLNHCNADPNIADPRGRTPLHFACCRANAPIAKVLLDRGSDPNRWDSKKEVTPLHCAARWVCGWSVHHVLAVCHIHRLHRLNVFMSIAPRVLSAFCCCCGERPTSTLASRSDRPCTTP